MNKLFIFLLIAVSLFVSLKQTSNAEAHRNQSVFISPEATPKSKSTAKIEKVELDRIEVINSCVPILPENYREDFDATGQNTVKTIVNNPKNLPITFQYAVSGGRIIGQGEKVIWDLRYVRPGTYTITATIKGDRGVSNETKTQEIKVVECPVEYFGTCPTISSITASESVKAGEITSFKAKISEGTAFDVKYNWTISQGEIIEGQGTSEIKVKTTAEMNGFIKAEFKITGKVSDIDCLATEAKITAIIK